MENFNLFDLLGENEEVKVFEQEQKQKELRQVNLDNKIVTPGLKDKKATGINTNTENANKEESNSKKATPKSKTGDAKIEEDCKTCKSITVKYFGNEIFTIDGEEDINAIKLNDIRKSLINDYNYQEFADGVKWYFAKGTDKSTGFLVATLKNFGNKG